MESLCIIFGIVCSKCVLKIECTCLLKTEELLRNTESKSFCILVSLDQMILVLTFLVLFFWGGAVTHSHMCAYLCSWDIQYINPSKIRSTGWVYRIPYPQLCSTQLSTLRTSYDNNAWLFFWTGFWSGWIEKCTCTCEWVSVRGEGDTFWLAHYHSHCITYTLILFGFYTIILMKGWLRRRLEEP